MAQADFSAETAEGVLVVAGDVDMASAPRLRAELSRAASRSGPFAVDLTAVSFLDSAGVAALFDELPAGTEVIVRARSVAARVLDIVGFDQHGRVTVVDQGAG